jgi:hypothetical protein
MNFKDLVESHPEVVQDRHSLSFSRQSPPDEIAAAFSRFGVVMLRQALPPAALATCSDAFRRFIDSNERGQRAASTGSWYSPWSVRDGDCFPAAVILSAVIRSWAWNVVEEFCGSSHIVVLLKWCMARHSIDAPLGVGGHQDAKVVAGDVPFSLWIPLGPIVPRATSGLGFVVPGPSAVLPTLSNDDIGADYVLSDPTGLWLPQYEAGDLTIHSRFSPHFTTGYGTLSDRFSIEIRPMPRRAAPPKYVDPAIYISRRIGMPTIVEITNSSNDEAAAFLASADLARVADLPKSRV